uniref:Uncharacterized protein n=1 Tax=Rhizophora mucronata TaxID=61149 RepID=A0A2P2NTS3_RHIMU
MSPGFHCLLLVL